MNKYKVLLFDIDGTILDFKKAERHAFYKFMDEIKCPVDEDVLKLYSDINTYWWEQFEKKLIDKQTLLDNRFKDFFEKINFHNYPSLDICNDHYLFYLGDIIYYIDNAIEVIEKLSHKYDLYFITNGVTKTQNRRLNKTKLLDYIKKVYISESIGISKPHKEFFDYVLNDIRIEPKDALIIGDSLTSDILGGINSNIDTVYFNQYNKPASDIIPNYQISNLIELLDILK